MGNFISSLRLLSIPLSFCFLFICFLLSSAAELEFCKFGVLEMSAVVVKVRGETGLVLRFHKSPFSVCC